MTSSIEPSAGETISKPTEDQILSILDKFGKGVDHCNFFYGNSFVAAYGSSSSEIYLFYSDDKGDYNSDKGLDSPSICRIFMRARDGDMSWKNEIPFTLTQDAGESGGADNYSGQGGSAAASSGRDPGAGSISDQLLNTVKSEASRNLIRLVQRVVRKVLGKNF